jgi:hypothetical protein
MRFSMWVQLKVKVFQWYGALMTLDHHNPDECATKKAIRDLIGGHVFQIGNS